MCIVGIFFFFFSKKVAQIIPCIFEYSHSVALRAPRLKIDLCTETVEDPSK